MLPVIWLPDDGGEATGFTVRFCSEPCRAPCQAAGLLEWEWGGWHASAAENVEDHCDDGEVCNHCWTLLTLKGGA